MMLALKVLNASYGIADAKVDPLEVTALKSYLGDAADGLPADQIACLVIQLELEKLRAVRGTSA
jgi:hypothetical protein